MIRVLTLIASTLLFAQSASADPAIFRDGKLWIHHGALIHANGEVDYYSNVYLTRDSDTGKLHILSVDEREQAGTDISGEDAFYENGEIFIRRGALVLGDGNAEYYTDVILQDNEDGSFSLTSAVRHESVAVDSASVRDFGGDTFPSYVTLDISGTKSSSCVDLAEPAYSRQNGETVFTVEVAEVPVEGESCQADPTPFNLSLDLNVCDCEPGDYTVIVNGQAEAEFTLSPSE